MNVISSREFNQDVSLAKRNARVEPVFVTDRGRPTHVLMSIETFRQITGQTETIVDLLAAPELSDIPGGSLRSDEAWDRREALG